MSEGRDQFATRLGFVLAASGSAVGLGNVWRFPYVAGANGGAAFLIIYLALVFSIGLGVMLAEMTIGRAGRANPVGAFRRLKGGPWIAVGYMGVIAGFVILSFYSVVGGWTLAYAAKAATGAFVDADADSLGKAFGGFISAPVAPILFHGLFMAATLAVVVGGVARGIERASKFLMPLLLVLLVLLVVRSVTLPGAGAGVAFFLEPDFSKVGWGTVHAALGQAFFSLSLGMGALLTYGSYFPSRESLPRAALMVTSLDTLAAVLAGFLILPAVFAFGFDAGAGPGLTFITLPAVFAKLPFGQLLAVAFFLLLAIAALTSAVSLLEVPVAYLVDERGWPRRRAAATVAAVCFVLGISASLSFGPWSDVTLFGKTIFDLMDYAASNVMLPLGGILMALFVGWVIWPRAAQEVGDGHGGSGFLMPWRVLCGAVAPIAVAWVLLSGL